MPVFSHIEIFEDDLIGFQLPVFAEFSGSNETVIQLIGSNGAVEGFTEVDSPTIRIRYPKITTSIEVEIGTPSVWAFSPVPGEFIVASLDEMKTIGRQLLLDGKLIDTPVVAAELAMWCEAEIEFPEVFEAAYTGTPIA